MSQAITLRVATLADAALLLAWRNDPVTRQASRSSAPVTVQEHGRWLQASITNAQRKLFIAERDGLAVGTARADLANGIWELSWTVAPQARGQGVASEMVLLVASQFREPIRAEVKSDNQASVRVARQAGMTLIDEDDGILHFARGAT